MKNAIMKCKIIVTYAEENFVMTKSMIIVTTPENVEVQHIVFVI